MSDASFNVLFICTGNSARSIIGEALINHLPICRGRFRGYSAGSRPRGAVNPHALGILRGAGVGTEGLRSKSWDEFAAEGAPQMDFIFTVCDDAAGEQCPYWPGHPVSAHWGMPDPAAVQGGEEQIHRAFHETLMLLRQRIELFASLPLRTLDRMRLHQELGNIGRR